MLCEEGKYSNETGETSEMTCTECPPHSFSGHGSISILNCTCNKGYSGPDGWMCTACRAGTYKDVNGSTPCTPCLQGKYSTPSAAIFASVCIQCPTHSHSGIGSGLLTHCICNKGYTGPDGVACTACIMGTYKGTNGSLPCSPCSQGKYSTETGETLESTCSDCPAHTFSGAGSIAQDNCTCNKGYTGPDGAECAACEAGGFKDVNGSAACTLCAQGKYSTVTAAIFGATCLDCPSYTDSGAGSGLLTNCTCNKGYTGPDGSECAACIAGTYKDINGSAPCSLCDKGKYSLTVGSIAESGCTSCSAGKFSPALGASSGATCEDCEAGKYLATAGADEETDCMLCEEGKYSTETAQISESTCSDCPAHTNSPDSSSMLTNCTCNKGYTGPDGLECAACIAGTYKDVNGSAPCSVCAEGTFSSHIAQTSVATCSGCPAHSVSRPGGTTISDCKVMYVNLCSMHVCVYMNIYIYVNMCMYVYIPMHTVCLVMAVNGSTTMSVCKVMSMYVSMYACRYVCMCVCIHVFGCVRVCVCACVSVRIHIHVYIYIYIHQHLHLSVQCRIHRPRRRHMHSMRRRQIQTSQRQRIMPALCRRIIQFCSRQRVHGHLRSVPKCFLFTSREQQSAAVCV